MTSAPFPYFGGKQRLAGSVAELFPAHKLYVEPYFGSGSLLLAKAPSSFEIVNDLDAQLVTFWQMLREQPTELERICRLTPHSRTELGNARIVLADDGETSTRLEIARRVFIQLTQGRGATLSNTTGWRTYRTGATSMASVLQGYCDRLAPIAARLAQVSIECRDAIDVIADYGNSPDALVVADPPYPTEVRAKGGGGRYRTDATSQHHHQLAETLGAITGKAVIFTYPNPLYARLYQDWNRIELTATKQSGTQAIEVAYLNYQPPREPSLLDFITENETEENQ
jgi:DNA adenine methylase